MQMVTGCIALQACIHTPCISDCHLTHAWISLLCSYPQSTTFPSYSNVRWVWGAATWLCILSCTDWSTEAGHWDSWMREGPPLVRNAGPSHINWLALCSQLAFGWDICRCQLGPQSIDSLGLLSHLDGGWPNQWSWEDEPIWSPGGEDMETC